MNDLIKRLRSYITLKTDAIEASDGITKLIGENAMLCSCIEELKTELVELRELLQCTHTNLCKGMSSSMQKLQARTIKETLESLTERS